MKKTATTIVSIALALTFAKAQSVIQKVYSDFPNRSSAFGGDLAVDETTLIVSDPQEFNSACEANFGAVHVYKRNQAGDGYTLFQTLKSNVYLPVNFGVEVAIHKNHMVVTSRDEPVPGQSYGSGALYLYHRSDANSQFEFVTKTFADTAWFNNNQYNISYFFSPSINDNYVAASVANTNRFWVYKIGEDTLLKHPDSPEFSIQGPAVETGLTENNVFVGSVNNFLNYFKITDDTIIQTKNGFSSGFNAYTHLAVNGNTVARRIYNSFSKTEGAAFELTRVGNNGTDSIPVTFDNVFEENLSNIALVEDQWLFGYHDATGLLNAYRYENGKYKNAGSIYKPTSSTSVFGEIICASGEVLALNDPLDSTQTVLTTGGCSAKPGKGAVTTFYTNGFNIITAIEGDLNNNSPAALLSPNPSKGNNLFTSLKGAERAEIMNASGQVFQTSPVTDGKFSLFGIPNGIYMVKLISPSEIKTSKLIIE